MKGIAKKLVLIAAIAVLALGLFACGGGKGIVGEWKIDSVKASGVTVTNKQYKDLLGSDIGSFTFNEDGTCVMSVYGTESTLDYEVDGKTVKVGTGSSMVEGTISGSKIAFKDATGTTEIVLKKS